MMVRHVAVRSGPSRKYFESKHVRILNKLATVSLLIIVHVYQTTNDVLSVVEASFS